MEKNILMDVFADHAHSLIKLPRANRQARSLFAQLLAASI